MPESYSFFATTAKGMEPLLVNELRGLGATSVQQTRAGASFEGPLELAYRACLWSRIANRVLLPLKKFPAPTQEKLYGGVKSIRWSDHMTPANTLAVDFTSSESQITHSHFGALKVKDAIVDQFRSVHGTRPSVNPLQPDLRINVYLFRDEASVAIDLSGDSLHRRGYREEGVFAPLKENLAAAILTMAGWTAGSNEGPNAQGFIDPMCGSGTLPIEAGMIAARIAPGLGRKHFGFLNWQNHVPVLWKRLLEEANEVQIRDRKKLPKIVGYDRDFRAVRVALSNSERAGMRTVVHIEKRELAACDPISSSGIIVANPPYGERLGEVEELRPLYKALGDLYKQKFKGWNGFVFTGSPELAKCVGLKTAHRHILYNGAIECRLLHYALY
ncbi:MAG TPA: THUMP domain-containing protein [Bdellovibrionota bacterium]|nr:THUMP domain-containing protein [Bdellovibrionota bacterium]